MMHELCVTCCSLCSTICYSVSSQKYGFFPSCFEAKVGRGHLLKYSVDTPPPPFLANFFVLVKSTITTTATEFWKISSLLNAYYEKSATLVFKLSHQELKELASSVVTRDTYAHPVRATKSLVLSSEWGFSIFVCTCLQTPSIIELNQKLTESMPRRRSIRILLPSSVVCGLFCTSVYLSFCASGIKLCMPGCPEGLGWLRLQVTHRFMCYCLFTRMKQVRTFPHNIQQSMSYMYVQNWKPAVTGRWSGQYQDQYSRWKHGTTFSGQQTLYYELNVFLCMREGLSTLNLKAILRQKLILFSM